MASKRRRLNQKIALNLRLPNSLHRKLERAAKQNGNSLNGEIVSRLGNGLLKQSLVDAVVAAVARASEAIHGQAATAGSSPQNGRAVSIGQSEGKT
jgi:coenzyme F420-reducing hydrogenase beta subunit